MINFKQHILIFSVLLITACFSDKTQEVNENDISSSSVENIISSSSEVNDVSSSSSDISIVTSSSGISSSLVSSSSFTFSSSSQITNQIEYDLFDSCNAIGEFPVIRNTFLWGDCYSTVADNHLDSITDSLSKNNSCESINDCYAINAKCFSFGYSDSKGDSVAYQHFADSVSIWREKYHPVSGCDPMVIFGVKSCTNSVCVYGWLN